MLREAVSPEQAEERLQSLKGKRVLITGGTTGIGRATARLLARLGAKILIFGRGEPDLNDALKELQGISDGTLGVTADQTRRDDLERVFQLAETKLGGLDILINNAGVGGNSVADGKTEEWTYTMQTDLLGYMHCCELAIPLLKKNTASWIINVGSMSAKVRDAGSDVYVAAKMGVRGFSDSLGRSVADDGIHVSLVEPGLVLSELK